MSPEVKAFMISQSRTVDEELELLKGQVTWGITHRTLISEDDIFSILQDTLDIIENGTRKRR